MIVKSVEELEKIDFTKLEMGDHVYLAQVPFPFPHDSYPDMVVVCRYLQSIQDQLTGMGLTNVILFPVLEDGKYIDVKELIMEKET